MRKELVGHEAFVRRLELRHELEEHEGCVNRLAWNEQGRLLASVSDDTQCCIWSTNPTGLR
jgi:WD and tetratricopeptide repeat-containing protein 1